MSLASFQCEIGHGGDHDVSQRHHNQEHEQPEQAAASAQDQRQDDTNEDRRTQAEPECPCIDFAVGHRRAQPSHMNSTVLRPPTTTATAKLPVLIPA